MAKVAFLRNCVIKNNYLTEIRQLRARKFPSCNKNKLNFTIGVSTIIVLFKYALNVCVPPM